MLNKSQKLLYQIIKETRGIDDKTVLAKLQYFADFIHYAFNGHPISEENIIYTRQKMGALSRTLTEDLETLKKEGYIAEVKKYHYQQSKQLDINLTGSELKTIRYVISKYGKLGYQDLVKICHEQEPYLSATDGGVIELFTAYNLIDNYNDYKDFS